MIFTIGYQKLTPADLKQIAEGLEAEVVDVRAKPFSRRPGFNRSQLESLLGSHYIWMGNRLGGGTVTASGIEWLRRRVIHGNVILMCLEHAPGECHRHHDICAWHFHNALHICDDELIRADELARAIERDGEYEIEASLAEWMSRPILRSRVRP